MNDATFIHGDFNLGNILVDHTSYTMIDWTNAQMGDRRYDLSWAGFLLRIYSGTQLYQSFLNTYLKEIPTSSEDIERFEAIACLRWLLLNRIAVLPKNNDTNQRINDFIMNHRMLSSRLCI
jgi:aminoglycoside phosphotransferase (APT) family kinase protein